MKFYVLDLPIKIIWIELTSQANIVNVTIDMICYFTC